MQLADIMSHEWVTKEGSQLLPPIKYTQDMEEIDLDVHIDEVDSGEECDSDDDFDLVNLDDDGDLLGGDGADSGEHKVSGIKSYLVMQDSPTWSQRSRESKFFN